MVASRVPHALDRERVALAPHSRFGSWLYSALGKGRSLTDHDHESILLFYVSQLYVCVCVFLKLRRIFILWV